MPSLLEALESKYFAECEFENANEPELHKRSDNNDFTVTKCGGRMEFSIFIPRLSPLTIVPELLVLNDCDIDCAGDFEAIKEKCQRVRELDLAQNKLRDWQEVFHIIKHMPRIEFLNLSKNQLIGPITKFYATPITNLKSLVLNGTYLDWLCVEALLQQLPSLEELHLSLNNYTEVLIDAAHTASETVPTERDVNEPANIPEDGHRCLNANIGNCCHNTTDAINNCTECRAMRKYTKAHEKLKNLHFTGNPIEHWHEVCRLGRVFPNLEQLVLANCPIKSLAVSVVPTPTDDPNQDDELETLQRHQQSEDEEKGKEKKEKQEGQTSMDEEHAHKYFANLKLLNLSNANLSTWRDIDELAKFPSLNNLRVKHWPLWQHLECTEHERRQLLIARLPNVGMLNGGGLIGTEEREDAERAFIRYYMDKPECERPQRYDDLVAKHGKLDPLVDINLKPDKHVKVTFTYNDNTEARLIDVYQSVADLKLKLEKLIGLPAHKMRLYYLDQDYKEFGPEEMRFPSKRLYSYNIQAGDEIIVDEKSKVRRITIGQSD